MQFLAWCVCNSALAAVDESPPVIVVEADFFGADAAMVAETTTAPIERQLSGVTSVVRIASQSTDGRSTTILSLAQGVDFRLALAAVKERIVLAGPHLPEIVRSNGVIAKIRTPAAFVVRLSSADGAQDAAQLSAVAAKIKESLAPVVGVGEVVVHGSVEQRVRVMLDQDRLTAMNLTAADVVDALRPPPAPNGAPANVDSLDRIESTIVLAGAGGQVVRVNDVARIELGIEAARNVVRSGGKPCVAVCISPTHDARLDDLRDSLLRRMDELRPSLPEGMRLDLAFDLRDRRSGMAEHLLLELHWPEGFADERIVEALQSIEQSLRESKLAGDASSFSRNPFDVFQTGACILIKRPETVKQAAAADDWRRAVRRESATAPGAIHRIRRLPTGDPDSMEFAVVGPEPKRVRQLAEKVADRLKHEAAFASVDLDSGGAARPRIEFHVDVEKAKSLGVSMLSLTKVLGFAQHPRQIGDVEAFDRKIPAIVEVLGMERVRRFDLVNSLKVRNDKGAMVPLASLVSLRTVTAPSAVERIDLKPAARLKFELMTSSQAATAREICRRSFENAKREAGLPSDYALIPLAP